MLVRPIAVSLALSIFTIAPAAAEAGLSQPERKAMNITRVSGASTETATFVEIRFKGNVADRLGTGDLKRAAVRVELRPASGTKTVITDRATQRKPKETRRGTKGRYDLARDRRTMLVLVEGLKAPVTEVEVTTLRPRAGAAQQEVQVKLDKYLESLPELEAEADLRVEIEDTEEILDRAESELKGAEREADRTIDRIGDAERDLRAAKSGARAREAREELKAQKEKLEELNERRRTLRNRIKVLRRWLKILQAAREGFSTRQCNDGNDNSDPEDTLADHPADPGCVDPADNDEKDEALPLACPAPGASVSPYAIINTPQTNSFDSFALLFEAGREQFFSSPVTSSSSAAAPLPGDLCGAGIEVTYQYVVYTDGDPFSLPDPPPGDHSICVFLRAENPQGSGNPGGQDASLRLAVGTVKQ